MIDVGGQGSPQQVFFGTEYRSKDLSRFIIPIEAVAGLFYVLIALMFMGLGQVMGRAFNAIPNHIAAYTMNIIGKLNWNRSIRGRRPISTPRPSCGSPSASASASILPSHGCRFRSSHS